MALQIAETKIKISDTVTVRLGAIELVNAVILLVSDSQFRLGVLNISLGEQDPASRIMPDTMTVFKHHVGEDVAAKILGRYYAKIKGKPVIAIVALSSQEVEEIRAIKEALGALSPSPD